MINEEQKRAVIYCRVSTKEQVEDGNSLAMQERICREYADTNGYEIAEIFVEQGESAKTADRTQLQNLLNFCAIKKHGISAVIAYKIDRVSRNTDDYSQIRIMLKRYGVEIKSTSEYFENTPAGRFMENIIANVAQFDNDVRAERSTGGMKEAVREGRYVWRAPLGYDNVKVNGKATIAPNGDAPLVKKAFELIASGVYSTEAVRIMIGKEGLINVKKSTINRSYFFRVVRNRLYTGTIVMFGGRHPGTFEPIISEALFEKVQLMLSGRKNSIKHYKHENPDFPLRRFVADESGRKVTGYWSHGRRIRYAYYTFKNNTQVIRKEVLEERFIDFLSLFEFNTSYLQILQKKLTEVFKKQIAGNGKEFEKIGQTLEERNKELDYYVKLNRDGDINKTTFKDRVSKLEAEIADLRVLLEEKPKYNFDINGLFKFAVETLKQPSILWEKSTFEVKLQLQRFYFSEGIVFNGKYFRTAKMCSLFKLKSIFEWSEFSKVNLRDGRTNTVSRRNFKEDQKMLETEAFWVTIAEELIELQRILSQ